MDKKYAVTALIYALLGLSLGIYMASSKNHSQHVTHAHIMLVGFVVTFIYAIIYKLWLANVCSKLFWPQFISHQLGALGIVVGLYCLYGGIIAEPKIGPVLGVASILVLAAMVMQTVLFIQHANKQ